MSKLTFKRGPKPTGIAAVGDPYASVDIKLNGQEVGSIHPPNWQSTEHLWRVWVRVADTASDRSNAWKNVCFKAKFASEQEARDWVIQHSAEIIAKIFLPED